jgi:D-arabinono-1,4-lactone oxidase
MDPSLQRELALIDPGVPFRALASYKHHTWARTFHSRPELYLQPESTDEIRKIIILARRCRRRIATTGCAHSPSDLTCTSSWLVNLDRYDKLSDVDAKTGVVVVQAGIRLHDFGLKLKDHGLAMPNLGSIDHQSIAGAIATATHGSSIRHGLLSQSVVGLKIMLANGRIEACSAERNQDLFRAALVSLGALGIILEVTFQAVPAFNIEWQQSLHPLDEILANWGKGLWTDQEFTRVWWMPYMKRCVKWRAGKTARTIQTPAASWWRGYIGFHVYQALLYMGHWVPRLLPGIERVVIGVQYGNIEGAHSTAVEEGRTGLLMNCLYSQFVNEWAIPLDRGPEAIIRLSAWLHGDSKTARIPYSAKGVYIHAPIEVRVTDSSTASLPRPYLDNSSADGPTLYLNATLYRPYGTDPPCRERYYQAFEWLMKEMNGRPHWAKNFGPISNKEIHSMYPELDDWLRVRNEADPDGMFVGDWHRRVLLPSEDDGGRTLPFEEKQASATRAKDGGIDWTGYNPHVAPSPQVSEDSFDMMHGAEVESNVMFESLNSIEDDEHEHVYDEHKQ